MTLQIITADCLSSSKHGFFTRHGGISSGIFKGLNCGAGSSDQSDVVIKNKSLVCDAMGVSSDKLMTVHQIHSAEVIISSDQIIGTNPKVDAIVSNTKGMAIGILTADCAPILFCDQATGIVGAAHSGWQGALKGIAQNTVKEMVNLGADISNIRAVVGQAERLRASANWCLSSIPSARLHSLFPGHCCRWFSPLLGFGFSNLYLKMSPKQDCPEKH